MYSESGAVGFEASTVPPSGRDEGLCCVKYSLGFCGQSFVACAGEDGSCILPYLKHRMDGEIRILIGYGVDEDSLRFTEREKRPNRSFVTRPEADAGGCRYPTGTHVYPCADTGHSTRHVRRLTQGPR